METRERFNGVIEMGMTHVVRNPEVEFFGAHQSTIKYKPRTLINQILRISQVELSIQASMPSLWQSLTWNDMKFNGCEKVRI